MPDQDDDQPNRRNGGSRPVPDPTVLTDRAIAKLKEQLEQYIDGQLGIRDERLAGIDRATELRLSSVTELPHTIEAAVKSKADVADVLISADRRFAVAAVAHQREVSDIRFQAAERLAARESELNALALAAAFAAQKEASAKEAEYTRIASSKSENATAEAISKLGQLFDTSVKALGDKVDDIKDRTGRIESTKTGATEQRATTGESRAGLYATIGISITVILAFLTILGFLFTRLP